MTITACEATNAIRLTPASKAGSAAALQVGGPTVGGDIADHPLPAIGTTYDPPASSFDAYA